MLTQSAAVVPPVHATGPPRRWLWSQHWRNLFFAHWRVPIPALLPFLPAGLELDTWDGAAWVSAVAFRLESVRLRRLPPCGPVSNFLEINLRTYVRRHGEPAILFLSLHGSSRLAVMFARWLTPLPYVCARIEYEDESEICRFQVAARQGNADPPLFHAEFRPNADREETADASLAAWLLERYVAYVAGTRDRLYRLVARHPRWQIQEAAAEVTAAGLGEPWRLDLGRTPDCCHFSTGVRALVEPFVLVPAIAR